MKEPAVSVLLADDDIDDCLLFEDALAELPISAKLSTVNDGEQLIRTLFEEKFRPEVVFLDLNMPRKNGFECLVEIAAHERTRNIAVIIFSTSFNPDIVRLLYAKGARFYIRKPEEFEGLKNVISKGILQSITSSNQVAFHDFVLNP